MLEWIDWTNPVADVPLNHGMEEWWLCGHGIYWGGPKMYGLRNRLHGAMTNGADYRSALGRPGGWGRVSCIDGTNDEVVFTNPSWLAGATQLTIAAWIYRASTSNHVALGVRRTSTTGGDAADFIWFTDNKLYVQFENGFSSFPSVALTGTGWHHIVVAYNGALSGLNRLRVHIDGVAQTLTAGGTDPPTSLVSDPEAFTFGRDNSNRWSIGSADSIRLYNIRVEDSVASGLYYEESQGYPTTLNRLRLPVFGEAGGAPATGPGGHIIGGGFGGGARVLSAA